MTDTSGLDPAVQASITPAQAEALQPRPNDRPLTGGEQLQKAVMDQVLPNGGLFSDVRKLTSPLPSVYDSFAQARAQGYSWDEINEGFTNAKQEAMKSGYSEAEVNAAAGLPNLDTTPGTQRPVMPPASAFEQNNIPGKVAGALRDFASRYLAPRDPTIQGFDFKPTAGYILKDLGWDAVDAAKVFGQSVVDGAAATAEMLDGRSRTAGDWARQALEASNFLLLFTPSPKGEPITSGPEMAAPAYPVSDWTSSEAVPAKTDVLDAATVLAKTAGTLETNGVTTAARVLGENYVQTGEHPLSAAARAQADPTVMDKFLGQMKDFDGDSAATAGNADEPIRPQNYGPDINPQSIRAPSPAIGSGIVDDFQRIMAPAVRNPEAAGVIREGLANNEVTVQQASDNLRRFGRAVGELPSTDRRAWFDAYETGEMGTFEGTPMGDLATELHTTFDGLYQRMDALGIAPEYVENYLPHLWQDPEGAATFFAGHAPLEGNKAFTRGRTYDLISQGLDAGLKLATDDPVEFSLMQIAQQSKYITAHEMIQELNLRGLVGKTTDFNAPLPKGLTKIDDPMFKRAGYSAYASDDVATLLNRYLSPGMSGRPIYDTMRSAASFSSQMKLIGSVFHPFLVSWDAIAGQMGLGIKQIERGIRGGAPLDVGRGLVNIGTSPIAPITNAIKGTQVINDVLHLPADAIPFRATLADALVQSGGRLGASEINRTSASGSFWRVIKGSLSSDSGLKTFGQEAQQMLRDATPVKIGGVTVAPAYIRAVAQGIGRAMDTVSAPIMDVMVPHMKVGAWASMMEDTLRAHPNLGIDEIRTLGGKHWDQVDNRLGQMTYDNLFWNKSLMDIGHVALLAPGWVLGKLRLLGSAGVDALKGGYVTAGEGKELSDNLTYLLGSMGALALTHATYGYLKGTWNQNWDWHDYLLGPPTGGFDQHGAPQRASLPSNMRDIYGWLTNPGEEAKNKISVLWSTMADLLQNEQYNGAAIHDPRQPFLDQAQDVGHFLANQFSPIITSQSGSAASGINDFERFLGIRQATSTIENPQRAEKYQSQEEKAAAKKLQKMKDQGQ